MIYTLNQFLDVEIITPDDEGNLPECPTGKVVMQGMGTGLRTTHFFKLHFSGDDYRTYLHADQGTLKRLICDFFTHTHRSGKAPTQLGLVDDVWFANIVDVIEKDAYSQVGFTLKTKHPVRFYGCQLIDPVEWVVQGENWGVSYNHWPTTNSRSRDSGERSIIVSSDKSMEKQVYMLYGLPITKKERGVCLSDYGGEIATTVLSAVVKHYHCGLSAMHTLVSEEPLGDVTVEVNDGIHTNITIISPEIKKEYLLLGIPPQQYRGSNFIEVVRNAEIKLPTWNRGGVANRVVDPTSDVPEQPFKFKDGVRLPIEPLIWVMVSEEGSRQTEEPLLVNDIIWENIVGDHLTPHTDKITDLFNGCVYTLVGKGDK